MPARARAWLSVIPGRLERFRYGWKHWPAARIRLGSGGGEETGMTIARTAAVLAAAALLSGCEAKVGTDGGNTMSNGPVSAEGKAEEGEIAFSAPGFDLKVRVPFDEAAADNESRILYPGSKLTGIYVAAHPDRKAGSDGSVELRFATPDPPDKVAAWYRGPARAGDFALGDSAKEGAAWSIVGR